MNQIKTGAALSYLSMALGYLIAIIYTPIMLRLLGQSEYGLYNLVASIVSYLGVLNFGFGSAYIRYYTGYKVNNDQHNIAKLNGMFLIIFTVIALIATFAGIILVINTEIILGSELTIQELSRAKYLMAIMVFNIALSFPNIVFHSHITANEKFIFQKTLEMLRVVANPFLVLPLLLLGYGSIGLVIGMTTVNILIEISNAIYCFKKIKIKFSFSKFDIPLMIEMTIFSSYIFINMVVDQINWNIDKFILGRFHGTLSVAIYGLAAQLLNYYRNLSVAVSSVFIPRVHQIVAKNKNSIDLDLLFNKIGRIQFMILALLSLLIIFFGKEFIRLWAGNNYSDSYPILILLTIPTLIPLIQNIGIEIQRALNLHKFRSWLYLFIALGNIAITIPLAKAYAGFGAALGTAITQIVGNTIIMNIYYAKIIGLDMKYFWKNIFKFVPSLLIPILLGILINCCIDLSKLKSFIFMGILYVFIYFISMWLIGMNSNEKNLLIIPAKKLLKKLKK